MQLTSLEMSFVMTHIYSKLLIPSIQKHSCSSNSSKFSQHSALRAFTHLSDSKHTHLEIRDQETNNTSPLKQSEESIKISPRALVVTTLMLAHKAYEDKRRSNSAWAQISGMKTSELNLSERECLAMMDYRLHMPAHVFESWVKAVKRSVQKSVFEARKKASVCQALSELKDRISGYRVETEDGKPQINFERKSIRKIRSPERS
ncbi:hypothetical protein HK096_004559 [Nowakowskiella sp. JEL0078]|nr:hypothetical protein HK096_004559 [Nowakowskiella sp. JEL0078]